MHQQNGRCVYCKNSNWENANKSLTEIEKTWSKSQDVLAIKFADQEYSFLRMSFVRLRSSILSKNVKDATTEASVCLLLFKNITSISPKP
ncbi:MAG: DUF4363 family protein [Bacillota bacterium]